MFPKILIISLIITTFSGCGLFSKISQKLGITMPIEEQNKLYTQAIKTKDEKYCQQIKNKNTEKNCQYSVIFEQAKEKHDPNHCANISVKVLQNLCREKVAN